MVKRAFGDSPQRPAERYQQLAPAADSATRDVAARHAEYQQLLLRFSDRFATLAADGIEGVIEESMREITEFYSVDRVSLWWVHHADAMAPAVMQIGLDARSSEELTGPLSRVPWIVKKLADDSPRTLVFPDEVPRDAEEEKEFFAGYGVKTCLIVPIKIDGELVGAATIASVRAPRTWSMQERDELTLLCRRLGNAWLKNLSDQEISARERDLQQRVAFQTRLATISTDFATSPTNEVRRIIDQALVDLAADYGFDRASLWQLDGDLAHAERMHEWVSAPEFRTQAQLFDSADAPLAIERISSPDMRIPLVIPEDLPESATSDRAYYENRGVKSALMFPIFIEGRLRFVFGLAALRQQRDWSKRQRTELTLTMHTIATAWLRLTSMREVQERETDLARSQRVAGVGSFSVFSPDGPPITEENAVVRLSAEASRLFAISPGEETLTLMFQRIHGEDRGRVYRERSKSVEDGSGLTLDYRLVRPDGEILRIEDRAEVDRDHNGQIVRVFGTLQDVTERTLAQEKLERAVREIGILKDRLQAENVALREEVRVAKGFEAIVGDSKPMRDALVAAQKVAPTGVTVLILGETGTGKELVARALHGQSERRDAPLISVNCAALSSDLIESELFGHEAGAFTGANKERRGRFELANSGTLFLDEIGDLPLDVQAKLLRVLQSGEFQRLGGTETLQVDVRVIAATNRNLARMVERNTFRADLYFRINNFPIELPALRERIEDIPVLANHFVVKHAGKLGKEIRSISAATIDYLLRQSWPGNVRELEGYVQRALISSGGPVLDYVESELDERSHVDTVGADLARTSATEQSGPEDDYAGDDLRAMQRRHIRDVLVSCNWVIGGENGAAAALGLPPSSLRSRMKKLGIERS